MHDAGDLAVEAEKKERIISQVLPAVTHDFLFHFSQPSFQKNLMAEKWKLETCG